MPSSRTPLLADSRRRSLDSDHRAEEEDAALRGYSPSRTAPSSSTRLREWILFAWALLATAAVIILAVIIQHRQQTSSPSTRPSTEKKNLIFMVSDGMGPASLSLTRSFRQYVDDLPIDDTLTLDQHFWGTSRTRSSSSLVTDSAAGATAFSCGMKSYNGAIAVDPDHTPCGTVLEAAKRAGYMTGLVVTTDVTDATPASFASHVWYRFQNDEIALQEVGEGVLGRTVDLIFGGGRCRFLANGTEGSCRQDDIDVRGIATKKHGWSWADSRAEFDAMKGGKNVTLPALGLFASSDVPFEVDRRNMADIYPSLSEMAATAIKALEEATKDSDKGFFLMIEGSRIDHAGHFNDPAAQVREVLEYDKTFKLVVDFLEESETEGVLVGTSDHETGGLATAYQRPGELPAYYWHPSVLAQSNASSQYAAQLLNEYIASLPEDSKKNTPEYLSIWINDNILTKLLGINDVSETELYAIATHPEVALQAFSHLISYRARIGWSTAGHSAVDVNIYSSGGPAVEELRGNVENTDIGKFLRAYLDVEDHVEDITKELGKKMKILPPVAKGVTAQSVGGADLHSGLFEKSH